MITGLSEHEIFIFVLQLGVIILSARMCGMLAKKMGQPILVGEVIAGIILGPSILGKALPHVNEVIFPQEGMQVGLIQGVGWLCVLFLLLVTGLEIDCRAAMHHAKRSILTSLFAVLLPFIGLYGVAHILPEHFYPPNIRHMEANIIFATSLSVVAIPVIAKILFDLNILRSFVGLNIMTAGILCDIWGWSILAVDISFINNGIVSLWGMIQPLVVILMYFGLALTAGRWIIDRFFDFMGVRTEDPTTVLAFLFALALLNGAIAHLLGLHVILGAFIAGLMAGESNRITPYMRQSIQDHIFGVFAPIFFVLIGRQINLESLQNWPQILFVLIVCVVLKVGGGFMGSVLGGIGRRNSFAVGCGLNTQGTMGIIVALIGMDLGVLTEELFSIIVFVCIVTSLLVGPLLKWAIKGVLRPLAKFFDEEHVFLDVPGTNKREIIHNMAMLMKKRNIIDDAVLAEDSLWKRESEMSTAIGEGVALPHARLSDLSQPVLCFFRLKQPVDFESPDNKPVQLLFLELTDHNDHGMQLNLITQISRLLALPRNRQRLLDVKKANEIHHILSFDEKA